MEYITIRATVVLCTSFSDIPSHIRTGKAPVVQVVLGISRSESLRATIELQLREPALLPRVPWLLGKGVSQLPAILRCWKMELPLPKHDWCPKVPGYLHVRGHCARGKCSARLGSTQVREVEGFEPVHLHHRSRHRSCHSLKSRLSDHELCRCRCIERWPVHAAEAS